MVADMDTEDPKYSIIPAQFHSAYPLDQQKSDTPFFGIHSQLFKVVRSQDALTYAMRRFEQAPGATTERARAIVDRWSRALHPNIITLREAFVAKDGGFCFVFVLVKGSS